MPVLIATLFCGVFMLTGCLIFAFGFARLRLKRFIENIPTVNIQTGALGTSVEIKGKVLIPEKSPISQSGGEVNQTDAANPDK